LREKLISIYRDVDTDGTSHSKETPHSGEGGNNEHSNQRARPYDPGNDGGGPVGHCSKGFQLQEEVLTPVEERIQKELFARKVQ
jgi:hypothetical protein